MEVIPIHIHTMRHFVPLSLLLLPIIAVMFCQNARAQAKPAPAINHVLERFVLYDADRAGPYEFGHSTASWIKDSDYTPKADLVEDAGAKWLAIAYEGRRGMARSVLDLKDELGKRRGPEQAYRGLEITVAYERGDFGKTTFTAFGAGDSLRSMVVALDKGTQVIEFKRGFTRKGFRWNDLRTFAIFTRAKPGSAKALRLKRVTLLVENRAASGRKLPVVLRRPVLEALEAKSPLTPDGKIRAGYAWESLSSCERFAYLAGGKAASTDTTPMHLFLGYGEKSLFLQVVSRFPTAPRADILKRDDPVWQDEALELFFSAEADNNHKIQFVINAKGIVFDYVREYDVAACMVMNRTQRDLKPAVHQEYAGGQMRTELAFALSDLKIDLSKRRFAGFQLVRNYDSQRPERELRTLRWSAASGKMNTDPEGLGMLVFNRGEFGAGEVSNIQVKRFADSPSDPAADFSFTFDATGFAPGEYTVRQHLVCADDSIVSQETTTSLGAKGQVKLALLDVKNVDGLYTHVLEIVNSRGDIRLAAVNLENAKPLVDRFGERIIWPRPKQVAWGKGAFRASEHDVLGIPRDASERTQITARLFAEKLKGLTGRTYRIEEGGERGIVLRLAEATQVEGKRRELKSEGYHLSVTPNRVTITGADEPGLFYGTLTVVQLLKFSMKREKGTPAPCVEILDWPDVAKRIGRFWTPDQVWTPLRESYDADFLMRWIDRYVAGNKFNLLMLDICTVIFYRRHPEVNFNAKARIFSLEDVTRITEFCRARFIEPIYSFPAGGHGSWLRMVRPEFREKGWQATADVAHPDCFPLYRDCVLDVIEATGCKYITPKLDEWWHKMKKGERPQQKNHGKTRAEAMRDFLVQLHEFLAGHGVRMPVYEDMLNPRHSGKRFEVYKIIDRLPKDIPIMCWAYVGGCLPTATYFRSKGLEVWANETGFKPITPDAAKDLHSGFGVGLYGTFGSGGSEIRKAMFCYMAQWFRGADYAWNFRQGNEASIRDEINSGVIPAVYNLFAVQPDPAASETVVPLDVDSCLNAGIAAVMREKWPKAYSRGPLPLELPQGTSVVGNIPTHFGERGRNCLHVRSGEKAIIPVKGRYSSLVFLQAGIRPTDEKLLAKMSFGRCWRLGAPFGNYRLRYADGSEEIVKVRRGFNAFWLRHRPFGGGCLDCRRVEVLTDANREHVFLYQHEWVNPKPGTPIVELLYESDPTFAVDTLIFAISGRLPRVER